MLSTDAITTPFHSESLSSNTIIYNPNQTDTGLSLIHFFCLMRMCTLQLQGCTSLGSLSALLATDPGCDWTAIYYTHSSERSDQEQRPQNTTHSSIFCSPMLKILFAFFYVHFTFKLCPLATKFCCASRLLYTTPSAVCPVSWDDDDDPHQNYRPDWLGLTLKLFSRPCVCWHRLKPLIIKSSTCTHKNCIRLWVNIWPEHVCTTRH